MEIILSDIAFCVFRRFRRCRFLAFDEKISTRVWLVMFFPSRNVFLVQGKEMMTY